MEIPIQTFQYTTLRNRYQQAISENLSEKDTLKRATHPPQVSVDPLVFNYSLLISN